MKKYLTLLLGMTLVRGVASVTCAQDEQKGESKEQKTANENKERIMSAR